jgi:hypothetical protein
MSTMYTASTASTLRASKLRLKTRDHGWLVLIKQGADDKVVLILGCCFCLEFAVLPSQESTA